MEKINKYDLKKQLNELLIAGKKITIDFNCGNDEAHITPFIDGKIAEYGKLYFNLEELIFVELNLPSNGEYMVQGSGYLTIEDNDIFLYYDLEGFTYDWENDSDDEEEENLDDEPKKNIVEQMKDSYLLLSREYDIDEKEETFPDIGGKNSVQLENSFEIEETEPLNKVVINTFSKEDQEIWDNLKGEEPIQKKTTKPWWKFW